MAVPLGEASRRVDTLPMMDPFEKEQLYLQRRGLLWGDLFTPPCSTLTLATPLP